MKRLSFYSFLFFYTLHGFTADTSFSGYANLVGARSTNENKYRGSLTTENNFDRYSTYGIQANIELSDDFDAQLRLARRWQNISDIELDLAQLRWRPKDQYEFRFGRIALPTWMISDHIDIKILYPWISPPEEVYTMNPLKFFEGAFAKYHFELMGARTSASLLYGSINTEFKSDQKTNNGTTAIEELIVKTRSKDLYGTILEIFSKHFDFRAAFVQTDDRTESISEITSAGTRIKVAQELNLGKTSFYSIGAKLRYKNHALWSEWAREISQKQVFFRQEGHYFTYLVNFQALKLTPNFTFSQVSKKEATSQPGKQKSYHFGLNYQYNNHVQFRGSVATIETSKGASFFDGVSTETQKATLYKIGIMSVF